MSSLERGTGDGAFCLQLENTCTPDSGHGQRGGPTLDSSPRMESDILIIGGGPAGISTALHLHARHPELAGRTLVLEKERYPREKYCAGAVGARALDLLAKIGVRVDVPRVPIDAITFRTRDHLHHIPEPGFGAVIRRIQFDHALAQEAQRRGIAVRDGAAVKAVTRGADGVTVTLADGETLRARVVVGADGVGSVVRRETGFSGGHFRAQVIELDTERAEGDPAPDTIHFDASIRDLQGYAWDFPTIVEGREMICRGVYVIRTLGADNVQHRLKDYLSAKGLDIKRYKLKPFGERGFHPGEPISKERVLLVGEAAGIDISTGEGIAQAITYGELASRYLIRAFETGDFAFSSWRRTVLQDRVGWNLLGRLMLYYSYFGPQRAATEAFLYRNPALLQVFAEEFAGHGPRARTLARSALGAGLWGPLWTARAVAAWARAPGAAAAAGAPDPRRAGTDSKG
jgi:flavin-dependent dehydrogenase